jgi:hypothetical protein
VVIRDRVFISYSKYDKSWLDKVRKCLRPLEDKGLKIWTDKDINTGNKWLGEIDKALEMTKVAVLLLSTNFFDSDFIQDQELPRILDAEQRGEVTILPILISACLWQETKIGEFQSPFNPEQPLNSLELPELDKALVQIALAIKKAWEKTVLNPSLPKDGESIAALAKFCLPATTLPKEVASDAYNAVDPTDLTEAYDHLVTLLANHLGLPNQRNDVLQRLKMSGPIGQEIYQTVERRDNSRDDYWQILQACCEYYDQGSLQLFRRVIAILLGQKTAARQLDQAFVALVNAHARNHKANG